MNFFPLNYKFLLFIITGFFLSCISTKKHYESIDLLKANHSSEIDECQSEIAVTLAKNERLNLQLAERQGEINVLLNLRQELYDTIAQLELALVDMGSQSASEQQNLNTELFQKQNTIKRLNVQLQQVDAVIDNHKETMEKLALELTESVRGISEKDILVTSSYDHVKVILSESFLFRKKSTTRLETKGSDALEKLSKVIVSYPNMRIMIVGHTDNTPPHKSFKDNWNFSVLQSATVARTLTNDFGISHNQVTASGKGEFNPRTSNATPEGKAANRRIELLIAPNPEDLVKAIQNKL
jgi:chemotaxis protein MotB